MSAKYFKDENTGRYVRRLADWVYIGIDIDPDLDEEMIIMDYELDEIIKALQAVRADMAREERAHFDRKHLADWNEGRGIQDNPLAARPVMMSFAKEQP